jgi:putative chitinase
MIELEGLEPAESGSYGGQGAIAAEIKNGKTVEGTENQRWTWNNGAWGKVDFNVTNSELIGIFDKGKADALKQIEITVNLQGSTYGIKSKQSLAHFISQAGHEVGGFTKGLGIEENLNYSVSGLIGTFGKYFYKGTAIVGKYDASLYGFIKDEKGKITQTANKEGIANIVYANRMGNGDFASGDGYKYRGRGIFQLTGKSNYKEFNTFLSQVGVDIVANPDLLITNEYSIKSAMWYYKTKVVDKLDIENTTVESVTKRVNGGTNGLAERKTIYNKAIEKLK